MNLVTSLALMLLSAESGGGGPAGDPTGVQLYNYSGDKIGVQWTTGDSTSSTEIGYSDTSGAEPSSVNARVGPGVETYETGDSGTISVCVDCRHWWVRHKKNGQVGSWVESSQGHD